MQDIEQEGRSPFSRGNDINQHGVINTVSVQNATPGDRVFFVWGLRCGITSTGGSRLYLSIGDPRFAGSAVADSGGTAMVKALVPDAAGDRTVFIQAVELSTCTPGNLVHFTFD